MHTTPRCLPLLAILPLAAVLALGCTAEEGDDDDSAEPTPVEPVLSQLDLRAEDGMIAGTCTLVVSFHVHDEQGDIGGALVELTLVRGGVAGEQGFTSELDDQPDAVDADISIAFTMPDQVEVGTDYDDLVVTLTDAAGNLSAEVSSGPFTSPDADCEM